MTGGVGRVESQKNSARFKGGKVDNLNEPLISQLGNRTCSSRGLGFSLLSFAAGAVSLPGSF